MRTALLHLQLAAFPDGIPPTDPNFAFKDPRLLVDLKTLVRPTPYRPPISC